MDLIPKIFCISSVSHRCETCYSHVDLVDLVLQLFVRRKVLQELLLLVLTASVSVVVVTAHVAARQLGLRVQIVGQAPGNRNKINTSEPSSTL